jgi:hypothetical protein
MRMAVSPHDRTLYVTESLLTEPVGEPLASVAFVQDNIQLDFGEARFTAYVNRPEKLPVVASVGQQTMTLSAATPLSEWPTRPRTSAG